MNEVLPVSSVRTGFAQPAKVAAGLALLGLSAAGESSAYLPGHPVSAAGDVIVGLAWGAAGLVLWNVARTTGVLMIAFGVSWLLGDLDSALVFLHRGVLAQVLLAYPDGRLGSPAARFAVVAAYADAVADPGTRLTAGLYGAGLFAATIARYLVSSGLVRRKRVVPAAVGGTTGAVLVAGALSGLDVLAVYEVVLGLAAVGMFVDLRTRRWATSAVTGLIIDLGRNQAGSVRDKLARTLGDPSLDVAYLLGDDRAPVDEAGLPVSVPGADSGRVVTRVTHDGRPLALLIHDPSVLREPVLVDRASSALAVAVANVTLQAEIRARMRDVEASTRRLLDAAETQRRRLAGELRVQVQPVLDRAGRALAEADPGRDLVQRLQRVQDRLGRLVEGLDPTGLEHGGLASALQALAEEPAMPVHVDAPVARFPRDVERCAWFVCSEALANVVKHAHAARAWITVRQEDDLVCVVVRDDGVGGANRAAGFGLRRLGERVEALGGRLTVDSETESGTRVTAMLSLRGRA